MQVHLGLSTVERPSDVGDAAAVAAIGPGWRGSVRRGLGWSPQRGERGRFWTRDGQRVNRFVASGFQRNPSEHGNEAIRAPHLDNGEFAVKVPINFPSVLQWAPVAAQDCRRSVHPR